MLVSLLLLLSDVTFIYWLNLSSGALGSNLRCMVAVTW